MYIINCIYINIYTEEKWLHNLTIIYSNFCQLYIFLGEFYKYNYYY